MIKPEIYDVIEIHSPIPENNLLAGMQGTLVLDFARFLSYRQSKTSSSVLLG